MRSQLFVKSGVIAFRQQVQIELAEKSQLVRKALALLDRSDVSAPSHAPTRQTRAWALYHLKRWDECLAEGRKAYELDPGNADTCNNLGLALWRLSRNEEALPWFDRALEIRPNFAAAFGNKIIVLFHLHRFDEVLRSTIA